MAVGNGATDWDFDNAPSVPQTMWGFNMITTANYTAYNDNGCVDYFNGVRPSIGSAACPNITQSIADQGSDYFVYDYYRESADVASKQKNRTGTVFLNGEERTYTRGMTPQEYTPWLGKFGKKDQTLIGDYQSDYLNRADVKTALNIPSWDNQTWEMCSNKLYANYHLQDEASIWIYPILRYANYRMVFYSGDTDGAVPTYGTKRWLQKLNWPLKDHGEWRAWHGLDTQVAGF